MNRCFEIDFKEVIIIFYGVRYLRFRFISIYLVGSFNFYSFLNYYIRVLYIFEFFFLSCNSWFWKYLFYGRYV